MGGTNHGFLSSATTLDPFMASQPSKGSTEEIAYGDSGNWTP